jgi:hypothetical protein
MTVVSNLRKRSGPTQRLRHAAALLVALGVGALFLPVACSSESDTRVLADDPSDKEVAGPRPTAPGNVGAVGVASGSKASATGANPALSGTVDIPELVRRLDALQGETDVCTLLTGRALADVTGADINLTSLLSDPTGFTQLFGGLQRTYTHLIDIAPAELDPPLGVLGNLWSKLAQTDPRSPDAQSAVAKSIGSSEVQGANDSLATWISSNCES